jgi:hypothetical protein
MENEGEIYRPTAKCRVSGGLNKQIFLYLPHPSETSAEPMRHRYIAVLFMFSVIASEGLAIQRID